MITNLRRNRGITRERPSIQWEFGHEPRRDDPQPVRVVLSSSERPALTRMVAEIMRSRHGATKGQFLIAAKVQELDGVAGRPYTTAAKARQAIRTKIETIADERYR